MKLHLFRSGTLQAPPGWFVREPGPLGRLRGLGLARTRVEAPVISFAIEHPEAGTVLVDTGMHPDGPGGAGGGLGPVNRLAFGGMRPSPEGPVREQLAARSLDPDAVRTVVMTHLHVDHAGGLAEFPGTTVLVDPAELAAARGRGAELAGYHPAHFRADVDFRPLSFDGPDASAYGGFERTLDLFGDGSVRAASTPGHSAGHLSLLVRTDGGDVLIAGDAIYTLESLQEGAEPLKMDRRGAYHRSVAQIRAFLAEHPDAVVIPGHDAAHWATLRPEY